MQRTGVVLWGLILIVLAAGGAWWWYQGVSRSGETACTAEALICPDGSSVGRTGAQCRFSACPDTAPLTGELRQDTTGFRLIIQAPAGAVGATYAVPLSFSNASDTDGMVGTRVTVVGTFTEGASFAVSSIAQAAEPDAHSAVLSVGQSRLIDGVVVTLNSVVQDNRCPVDVVCIEGGAITANVTLLSDTDHENFNMPSDEVPHPFDSYQVSITKIDPPRHSGHEVGQADYRITFHVDALAH